MIIWFTGQPGSGKTTLANELKEKILYSHFYLKHKIIHLDGDELRNILNHKDYTESGRKKLIQFVIDMATVLDSMGYFVIISLLSQYRDMRIGNIFYLSSTRQLRKEYWVDEYEIPKDNFTEINTDLSVEKNIEQIIKILEKNNTF
tara:strand:+ start:1515 stop:1952 length:438 start_codon:yes stop_codon:yes gene_type:complete